MPPIDLLPIRNDALVLRALQVDATSTAANAVRECPPARPSSAEHARSPVSTGRQTVPTFQCRKCALKVVSQDDDKTRGGVSVVNAHTLHYVFCWPRIALPVAKLYNPS